MFVDFFPPQSLDDLSNVSSDDLVQLHAYISDTGKRLCVIFIT